MSSIMIWYISIANIIVIIDHMIKIDAINLFKESESNNGLRNFLLIVLAFSMAFLLLTNIELPFFLFSILYLINYLFWE